MVKIGIRKSSLREKRETDTSSGSKYIILQFKAEVRLFQIRKIYHSWYEKRSSSFSLKENLSD